MRTGLFRPLGLFLSCCAVLSAQSKGPARPDPSLVSLHPFTVQAGTSVTAIVRGSGLAGARLGVLAQDAIRIVPETVETEAAPQTGGRNRGATDRVQVRIEVAASVKPGRYPFRLVGANGVSNALPLHVVDLPVRPEPEGRHATPDAAVRVENTPTVYAGRLSGRGEADYYAVQAKAGETITFELLSGLPQIASAGSAATIPNFDPALSLWEGGGSWFDDRRLKRIAQNDEPVWVFGKPTDAHLVHRFDKTGSYLLRIDAFAGQGGADYGYQLKIRPGVHPQDLPAAGRGWEERSFGRPLSPSRLNEIARRGGDPADRPSIETYRGAARPAADAPQFSLPGTLDGELTTPGETHRARFQLDGPKDIAIEVETPATAPPFFNPIVRLLNAAGEEVATNLFAGKGACSGALTKSLQAKTIVPLKEAGMYTLELRDATADLGGPGFRYKLQVRPQVPHVGKVTIEADHVNLAREEARTVRVVFDREEDYRGAIAVMAESLPPGVQAAIGADFEPDKDPPPAAGKRERYVPRQERAVVVLTAAPDAPVSERPQMARIVVRPVANGRMGEIIARRDIPMMVIAKP